MTRLIYTIFSSSHFFFFFPFTFTNHKINRLRIYFSTTHFDSLIHSKKINHPLHLPATSKQNNVYLFFNKNDIFSFLVDPIIQSSRNKGKFSKGRNETKSVGTEILVFFTVPPSFHRQKFFLHGFLQR